MKQKLFLCISLFITIVFAMTIAGCDKENDPTITFMNADGQPLTGNLWKAYCIGSVSYIYLNGTSGNCTVNSSDENVATAYYELVSGTLPRIVVTGSALGSATLKVTDSNGNNGSLQFTNESRKFSIGLSIQNYSIQGVSKEDSTAIANDIALKHPTYDLRMEQTHLDKTLIKVYDRCSTLIHSGIYETIVRQETDNEQAPEVFKDWRAVIRIYDEKHEQVWNTYWTFQGTYLGMDKTDQYLNEYSGLTHAVAYLRIATNK